MEMHMHPEQHTVNSAALLHEVLNEMEKLDLEYLLGIIENDQVSFLLLEIFVSAGSSSSIPADYVPAG
ncbi:hypothetical protein Tco_0354642, partial [Tanacetum coccineum]